MDLDQKDGKKNPRVFINPKILWASEEMAIFEEGCLSVPEIWDDVERPARIKAEYLDRDGKQQSWKPTACSPPACSMRWTIWKACCSSTISRGSSAPCAQETTKAKKLQAQGRR